MTNDNYLSKVINSTNIQDSVSSGILLSIGYDVTTGVFDHRKHPNKPFAVELAHDIERYNYNSGVYSAIERYIRQNIKDKFGLSLIEYLSMPRDYLEKISQALIDMGERKRRLEELAKREAEAGKNK